MFKLIKNIYFENENLTKVQKLLNLLKIKTKKIPIYHLPTFKLL